jgi:hypothetical protein
MSGATKILAAAGGAGGEGEYVEDVLTHIFIQELARN